MGVARRAAEVPDLDTAAAQRTSGCCAGIGPRRRRRAQRECRCPCRLALEPALASAMVVHGAGGTGTRIAAALAKCIGQGRLQL